MKEKNHLLINYPLMWSTKFHYIVFISITISILLVIYELTIKFQLDELYYMYSYSPYLTLILFIYWLYKQKFYIQTKNYGKSITNPFIEFQIYFFSILFFFLPFLIILSIFFNITKQYDFTEEELKIVHYTFKNNQYSATCHNPFDNYTLSELGEEVCIGDKEFFDKVIFSLTQKDFSDEINFRPLDIVKEKLQFIDNKDSQNYIFGVSIPLIIIFTVWFILLQIIGFKKGSYLFITFFIFVSAIAFLSFESLGLFQLSASNPLSIFIYFFALVFFTILVFILYKFYKNLTIFFLLINFIVYTLLIFIANLNMNIFNFQFLNNLISNVPFFILVSIIIKPMVKHIVFLNSKPSN